MARFTTTGGSGDGTPGAPGADGADGADGSDGADGTDGVTPFTYQGAFDYGVTYGPGDAVTFQGGLWKLNNFIGAAGYTPVEGQWTLIIPAGTPGADGADGNDGAPGADGAQGPQGDPGSPGLVYLGDFIAGNGYVSNLAVVKGSDNNLYIAKASGELGSPIANPGQWELFLPKGETGSSITWSGAWDSGTNYPVNYVVSDNGSSYIKILTDPSGVFPLTSDTQYWNLLAEGGSGTANIADFVFTNVDETNSSITVTGNKELTIQSGSSEDLNVRAGDDLWLEAGDNILVQADDELNLRSQDSTTIITNYVDQGNAQYEWQFGSQGYLTLPGGGEIINSPDSSGDGSGYSTLQLDPDNTLETDQYIIIDPTAPNHIHIRAGGTQDTSTADLFLGGERNNIRISDPYRIVTINTKPQAIVNNYANSNQASNTEFMHATGADIFVGDTVSLYTGGDIFTVTSVTQEYPYAGLMTVVADGLSFITGEAYTFTREQSWNHEWAFGNDGVLSGPAQGGIRVNGIEGNTGNPLYLNSTEGVVLSGNDGSEDNGVFLNNTNPENQIATIGDVTTAVGVGGNGEVTRWTPNFTATGLTFTGSGATHPAYNSYYVKNGRMVSFNIEVNMSTVTNFGTGQYKLQLPFTPQFGFNHFSGWIWADPNVDPDTGTGHTILNADTAGVTDVLDLHYLKQSGGANSPIREELFLQGTPVTLSTISKIYVNGTYITSE